MSATEKAKRLHVRNMESKDLCDHMVRIRADSRGSVSQIQLAWIYETGSPRQLAIRPPQDGDHGRTQQRGDGFSKASRFQTDDAVSSPGCKSCPIPNARSKGSFWCTSDVQHLTLRKGKGGAMQTGVCTSHLLATF